MTLRVHIWPTFRGEDEGDGGVRRVVDAQRAHLPAHGIELVDDPEEAELIAAHISAPATYFVRFADRPFVIHSHGLYWQENAWPNWCLKANADCLESIRRANAVTAPSEWVAQVLRRHTMRRVVPIGHGIDLGEWEPGEDRGYALWNKNRADPICNPTPVNLLANSMPEQRFVTTFANAAPNIEITGRLPYGEAKEILRHAAVYLCTVRETFGIGTLEAMACGVPVVGWACGGQREIIRHGETGWLAEPGDIEGLAEGMRWARENRREVAERARAEVEGRYQWCDVVAAYADLYRQTVAGWYEAKPKVSVVVTAYKLEDFLPACLDSVAAQTLQDWECVVVDDASPDACGAIADDYAARDPRFRAVHNRENQYQPGARNTGIAASRGRYVLPLDADDMLPPGALATLSGVLDGDRSIHVAYGNVEFLEASGERWHSGWPIPFRHDWQLMQRNLLPYSSMFRREVWEWTCGYRTRCRTADDPDFWARASSYGFRPRMVTTADTLIYRNRPGSMSKTVPMPDWARWFPWAGRPELTPAGAVTEEQGPVPSLEPPQVAVVIPVGPGHERLAMDAVDSVDAQTYRQWECVVVNDTGKPLATALPSWVRLVTPEGAPVGVAAARNLGIGASAAPLFVLLDADDYLQPHALESLMQVWQEIGGVVYSNWWEEVGGETRVYEPPDYDAELLITKGCIHAVTALYPREAWERVGGFDEALGGWEDWDLQLALADVGVCGSRVPAPLWVYRKDMGLRREEAYADFEGSKNELKEKWGLWRDDGRPEERRQLMACGGCPGGGGKRIRPAEAAPQLRRRDGPPPDDMVVVEYTGDVLGARTFRGPGTGAQYRFDASEGGRLKYVFRADAERFLNRSDFRILDGMPQSEVGDAAEGPEITAPGPPRREAAEAEAAGVG